MELNNNLIIISVLRWCWTLPESRSAIHFFILPFTAFGTAMVASGIRLHNLYFLGVLLGCYIVVACCWQKGIVAALRRVFPHPYAPEYTLFVMNSLALFGLFTVLVQPHSYLCFLYILPLVYLSVYTNLKTTFAGALFLTPLLFFTLYFFHLPELTLLHNFITYTIFTFGTAFLLAYPIDYRHQQLQLAEKQVTANSEELASAYEQLKAYTQVLEATTQELEKKTLNLSAINTFNQILNSRLNWSDLHVRILGFVVDNFHAANVYLVIKAQESKFVEVIAQEANEYRTDRFPLDKRNWFYLSLFEAAHLVKLNESELPEYREDIFWTHQPAENLAAVPLYRGKDIFGALILTNISRELNREDLDLLQITANQIAIATERSRMYDELEQNYLATLKALADSIEAKDPYTRGHSERVTHMALMIGEAMDFTDQELSTLHYGGILHDIGKIGVPEEILNKSGSLTQNEYRIIQRHPVIGEEIVASIPFLHRALPLIRHHHERYDGQGYPDGLAGNNIPLPVKILSVCDAFDAMNSNRPYRKALPLTVSLQELKDKAGTQFDPEVIDVFFHLIQTDPTRFTAPL
jgi:HD-GYP domain-containing protein (c-di-GMP phosphodiesterase class II)